MANNNVQASSMFILQVLFVIVLLFKNFASFGHVIFKGSNSMSNWNNLYKGQTYMHCETPEKRHFKLKAIVLKYFLRHARIK